MERIADGVWQVELAPRDYINAFVVGDVLVDAGMQGEGGIVTRKLDGITVNAHVLTHAHFDHAGGSRYVTERLGIPCWVHGKDAAALQSGRQVIRDTPAKPLLSLLGRWAPVRIERRLKEGDEIGGFKVLETPGFSRGHISLWRESDRVLIAGDVWMNSHPITMAPGLRPPPWVLSVDPAAHRRSMQRLIDLEPDVVCFGHGATIRDAAAKLRVF